MKLSGKSAEEAAEIVSKIAGSSYLAHSIRGLENDIIACLGQVFRIGTYYSKEHSDVSKAFFSKRGCLIRLPFENESLDEDANRKRRRNTRIKLAHELGHIVYNIDHLKYVNDSNEEETFEERRKIEESFKILNNENPPLNEELYAWEFAYHLIKKKSDSIKSNNQTKNFCYINDMEVRDDILLVVAEKKLKETELYRAVEKSINKHIF